MAATVGLRGRRVIVLGAAGGVGTGITRELLRVGATVIAVSRHGQRLEDLRRSVAELADDRLVPLVSGLSWRPEDRTLVARFVVERWGRLDGAVASVGSWLGSGTSVLHLDQSTWEAGLRDNLTSHLLALQQLVPLLSMDGSLVHLSGMSAEMPFPPAPLIGITNAARKSLILTLAEELRATGPAVHEILLGVIRTPARLAQGFTDERFYTPEEVGEYVARLLAVGTGEAAGGPLHRLVDRVADRAVRAG